MNVLLQRLAERLSVKNPKTTGAGYLLATLGFAYIALQIYRGQTPDFAGLLALLNGVGLIAAADGGH